MLRSQLWHFSAVWADEQAPSLLVRWVGGVAVLVEPNTRVILVLSQQVATLWSVTVLHVASPHAPPEDPGREEREDYCAWCGYGP